MRRMPLLVALLAGPLLSGAASAPEFSSGRGGGNSTQITQCNNIDQPGRALPACSAVISSNAPPITRSSAYTNRGVMYFTNCYFHSC